MPPIVAACDGCHGAPTEALLYRRHHVGCGGIRRQADFSLGGDMTGTPPVTDWARDYDIFDPDYIVDPFIVWDDLRHSCPIARSERWGGTWMPTTYADVNAIAHDIAHFSSSDVGVLNQQDPDVEEKPISAGGIPVLPPISVDPPLHTWTRRLMLPWFSHRRVEEMETITRELCRSLLAQVVHQGHADAARDYARLM